MDSKSCGESLRSASISLVSNSSPPSVETVNKLKELLRQESRCHQETGHCYNTLQQEYDELLRKYAEAENTIDKLRIGAKIKLYYEPQSPREAQKEAFVPARSKSTQLIHLAQPQKAHLSRTHSVPDRVGLKKSGHSASSYSDTVMEDEETDDFISRLQCLQNDVSNFHTLVSEGECDIDKQKEIYERLKEEYETVKDELKSFDRDGEDGDLNNNRIRATSLNSR